MIRTKRSEADDRLLDCEPDGDLICEQCGEPYWMDEVWTGLCSTCSEELAFDY